MLRSRWAFKPEKTDVYQGKISIKGYEQVFAQMQERFGFKYVASTLRESYSASDNGWSTLVYDGKTFCQSRKYDIHLVDRGGGGASFSAGLIYGILQGNVSGRSHGVCCSDICFKTNHSRAILI